MSQVINQLKSQFEQEIAAVKSVADIEELKVKYLGRKGPIQAAMKELKDLSPEERPLFGKAVNDLKEAISSRLDQLHHTLEHQEDDVRLQQEILDVTIPGRKHFRGNKHILIKVMDEIIDILVGMGFTVQYGPDIETDYYNFEALNFTPDHPAKDMQDTFYIEENVLLRTHTTNIQARVMEAHKPPIRIISPGVVYRNETITARSHVFFHQVDPLYIDKGVTFADLLATLKEFLSKLFHTKVETRFRSSYFPFVEPGIEVDIRCLKCGGSGCNLCKSSGWLEVLGAGMVHPEVLKNGGIDPEVYSGYAWGMGIARLVMLRHGVSDIRMYTQNDLRFLAQF